MARDFDGNNQKLEIATHPSLNSVAFTYGAWVKLRQAGLVGTIVGRVIGSDNRQHFTVGSSNQLSFFWDYAGTNLQIETPGDVLILNKWAFVLITGDGSDAHANYDLYVDGIRYPHAVGIDGDTIQLSLSATVTRIGLGFLNINDFNGRIAHFQMLNRKIRDTEVASMMNVPGSITRGLVSYLPMTGGSPEPDYSGNGNSGAVTGATYEQDDNPPIMGMFYPRFSRMMRYAVPASVNPEVEWELHDSYPIFMNMKFNPVVSPAIPDTQAGRRRRRTLVGVGR